MTRAVLIAVFISALIGGATRPARAQQERPRSLDWAFGSPVAEAALGAGSLLSLAAFALPQRETSWGPSSTTARNDLFGGISDFSGSYIGSLWQITGSFALEASYLEDQHVGDPLTRALRAALSDTESALWANGITTVIKRLSGRCRPRAWRQGSCEGGEHDAFPSGHVAPVAAVAGSRLTLTLRSDGGATARLLAFGFAETAAVVTAVMRVLAGAHSWEDVLAGWAIGHGTGALVSAAHPLVDLVPAGAAGAAAEPPVAPQAAAAAPVLLTVGGRW